MIISLRCHSSKIITTEQLPLLEPKLKFFTNSNLSCILTEINASENPRQWPPSAIIQKIFKTNSGFHVK